MKKIALLAFSILALTPLCNAYAQSTAQPVVTGYLTTSGCPSGQTVCFVQYGAAGPVGSTTTVVQPTASNLNAQVVGNVASGSAESGNPIAIAGITDTNPAAGTTGNRREIPLGQNGAVYIGSSVTTAAGDGISASSAAIPAGTGVGRNLGTNPYLYNGSTADQQFTCAASAPVNVTASATTQIIALSGTTKIRVCEADFAISVAGTVSVVTGTGTNCGTGTVTLVPAMPVAVGQELRFGNGMGSVFRSAAGGEICVSAATGTVTGVMSYAQYN